MSVEKLLRKIKIVEKAFAPARDSEGYDAEGKDRYGRSREMMERARREEQAAFDSLTLEQQDLVMRANMIGQKYEEKAVEWESQPEQVKPKSRFYEEYMSHSDITKHSFLFGVWATEEEKKLCNKAALLMIRARNKLFPVNRGIH